MLAEVDVAPELADVSPGDGVVDVWVSVAPAPVESDGLDGPDPSGGSETGPRVPSTPWSKRPPARSSPPAGSWPAAARTWLPPERRFASPSCSGYSRWPRVASTDELLVAELVSRALRPALAPTGGSRLPTSPWVADSDGGVVVEPGTTAPGDDRAQPDRDSAAEGGQQPPGPSRRQPFGLDRGWHTGRWLGDRRFKVGRHARPHRCRRPGGGVARPARSRSCPSSRRRPGRPPDPDAATTSRAGRQRRCAPGGDDRAGRRHSRGGPRTIAPGKCCQPRQALSTKMITDTANCPGQRKCHCR